jgi:hypothetical protein
MTNEPDCSILTDPRDMIAAKDLWVPKMVEERLIEAVRIANYTAGSVGPRGYGSGLPGELVALLGQPENEGEKTWWERASIDSEEARPKRAISAQKVTKMEEAIRWPLTYLDGQDGPCRVLALYLRCKVTKGRPFNAAVKKKKWSRATAYRVRDRALSIIAQGLNRDRVPF